MYSFIISKAVFTFRKELLERLTESPLWEIGIWTEEFLEQASVLEFLKGAALDHQMDASSPFYEGYTG